MAAVAVIFGGMAGLISAVVALVLFNASWLLALGLWAAGGAGLALVLILLSLVSRQPRLELATEHA